MRLTRRLLRHGLLASGLLAVTSLTAARADEMSLRASAAWSRPTVSAAMAGVVYVTVTDSGAPTTLLRVSTPIAAKAEMHRSLMQNGMMEMLPVKSLSITQGSPITFSPGGYHIMLTGLTEPLSAGQTFPAHADLRGWRPRHDHGDCATHDGWSPLRCDGEHGRHENVTLTVPRQYRSTTRKVR